MRASCNTVTCRCAKDCMFSRPNSGSQKASCQLHPIIVHMLHMMHRHPLHPTRLVDRGQALTEAKL